MFTFKFVRFAFVVYVSHTVHVLFTVIILNITSREYLTLALLHIGSRLFELFGKEVRVKKQPGMPLKYPTKYLLRGSPTVGQIFFFSPPAHLQYVPYVTYITDISLNVT